jgi:hypothetical protein
MSLHKNTMTSANDAGHLLQASQPQKLYLNLKVFFYVPFRLAQPSSIVQAGG